MVGHETESIITRSGRLVLSYSPTLGPNVGKRMRWRANIETYFVPRAAEAAWRARAGLPDGRTTLTLGEQRRFILPVAEQDWAAYCLGTGPDPRVPPAALLSNTRTVVLIAD
jgi:hypothetical protein